MQLFITTEKGAETIRLMLSRREWDVLECEQNFGKTLHEEVKTDVTISRAPSQMQNHCQLNSHSEEFFANQDDAV